MSKHTWIVTAMSRRLSPHSCEFWILTQDFSPPHPDKVACATRRATIPFVPTVGQADQHRIYQLGQISLPHSCGITLIRRRSSKKPLSLLTVESLKVSMRYLVKGAYHKTLETSMILLSRQLHENFLPTTFYVQCCTIRRLTHWFCGNCRRLIRDAEQ